MKKLLLTLVALMGMVSATYADQVIANVFTQADDTTYYIPIDQSAEMVVAYQDAGGQTVYDWGYYCILYLTDDVLYSNDYFTLASATDQGYVFFTNGAKWSTAMENDPTLDLTNYGYMALGSTLDQHIYAEDTEEHTATTITFSEEEINALSLEYNWQATLSFTPTVSGTLGFKVAVTNARSIAIFKVPTLEEYLEDFYEGEWVAINDFSSDDCPASVLGEVEAGREYYMIAGSTGVNMYEFTFNPSEETGISEVSATAKSASDGKIYSLDGRYVSGNGLNGIQKGVYIMNGKKYVVK